MREAAKVSQHGENMPAGRQGQTSSCVDDASATDPLDGQARNTHMPAAYLPSHRPTTPALETSAPVSARSRPGRTLISQEVSERHLLALVLLSRSWPSISQGQPGQRSERAIPMIAVLGADAQGRRPGTTGLHTSRGGADVRVTSASRQRPHEPRRERRRQRPRGSARSAFW